MSSLKTSFVFAILFATATAVASTALSDEEFAKLLPVGLSFSEAAPRMLRVAEASKLSRIWVANWGEDGDAAQLTRENSRRIPMPNVFEQVVSEQNYVSKDGVPMVRHRAAKIRFDKTGHLLRIDFLNYVICMGSGLR